MSQEKILVIKLSALGDFFLAMGAMEAIRKAHKDAHITLLTTKMFHDIAQRSGYFDEIVVDTRPKFYQLAEWLKLFKFFNKSGFTRVYDLQFNSRTKWYHRLFIKKPEWSGVISGSKLFYPNKNWRNMHSYDRHKAVLAVVGIEMKLPDISWMSSDITHLNIKKPYVLFVPGSAPQHPGKRWSSLRYGALARKLINDGYNIVLIGTKAEEDIIGKIKTACSDVIDLSGQTSFYDIATLARGSSGTIGSDTGPSHIAALAGSPTLVLFCTKVSSPELSAPAGASVKSIQADDLEDVQVNDVYYNFTPKAIS